MDTPIHTDFIRNCFRHLNPIWNVSFWTIKVLGWTIQVEEFDNACKCTVTASKDCLITKYAVKDKASLQRTFMTLIEASTLLSTLK